MKAKRILAAAAGVAALVLSGALIAAPGASADEDGIHELPRDQQLPSFPGLTPSFDSVTVVDAHTGAVIGMRPNVQTRGISTYTNGNRIGQLQWKSGSATITGPKTTGPVAISGGPVTIVKVSLF